MPYENGSQAIADAAGLTSADIPNDCADCMQLIDERDGAQDAADELAYAIANFFGEDIGEHSNLNCPWQNALEVIQAATAARQQ